MLVDKKILESERNQVYVKSNEGVRLNGSVAENKDVFDKFPQLIMNKYNELIDLLIASGLDTVADDFLNRYTKTETDSLVETETCTLVADIGVDLATGVITVTKKDGSKTTIDTALEKVPSTFEFVEDTENDRFYLKVTNVDGTSSQTEVTNLMNQYTFSEGDIVSFVISKSGTTTTVTANIKNGSIGLAQLSTEVKQYYEEIKSSVSADRAAVEADKAVVLDASQTVTSNTTLVLSYKEAAEENALLSKSYAIGNTGIRAGEDTDNSMYYSNEAKYARNQAQAAQTAAEKARDEAQEIAGGDYATKTELNEHANNSDIHVTTEEKAVWSEKEVFIATLTSTTTDGVTTYSCDKTFDEIKAANDKRKICVLKSGLFRYILSASIGTQQIFFTISNGNALLFFNGKDTGWAKNTFSLLPIATSADKDKILTVDSNGNPIWSAITNAEGVAY